MEEMGSFLMGGNGSKGKDRGGRRNEMWGASATGCIWPIIPASHTYSAAGMKIAEEEYILSGGVEVSVEG